MNTRKTYHPENEAVGTPEWEDDFGPILEIAGLKEVAPGRFKLSGTRPRPIDGAKLAEALGTTEDDLELMDKVLSTVHKFDIIRLLADRIKY